MSLTDDWKAGKLKKNKNYFVRVAGKRKYTRHVYIVTTLLVFVVMGLVIFQMVNKKLKS